MGDKVVTIIVSIIVVLIIICGTPLALLFFMTSSNDVVDFNNVEEDTRNKIIGLIELEELSNDIKLIKAERPNVYRDIFYKIYFSLDNNDNILENAKNDDIYGRDFEKVKNNQYCCTIYRLDDNQIDLLENLFQEK